MFKLAEIKAFLKTSLNLGIFVLYLEFRGAMSSEFCNLKIDVSVRFISKFKTALFF